MIKEQKIIECIFILTNFTSKYDLFIIFPKELLQEIFKIYLLVLNDCPCNLLNCQFKWFKLPKTINKPLYIVKNQNGKYPNKELLEDTRRHCDICHYNCNFEDDNVFDYCEFNDCQNYCCKNCFQFYQIYNEFYNSWSMEIYFRCKLCFLSINSKNELFIPVYG